ncbi:MAG: VWA domain-containing protein [Bacteroidia bacterium]|nr:VWA domain-containing protein [Bacteroidia bacterium]
MNMLYRIPFILILLIATGGGASAQWTQSILDVKTDRFPLIDVHVALRQNQALVRTVDSSQFRLWEDGHEQAPLTLFFEDAQKSFSLGIVIPVTSTMTAGDIATAKGIGLRIVDRMNGLTDEACVYDGNVLPRQDLTHIKPFLIGALDGLQPGGSGVSIWDGTYAAINEVAQGSNPDRAIILISNGRGGSGTRSVVDVINFAKSAQMKVYCYGVNAVNSDQEMKDLAAQTGGTFYINADLLVQEIIDLLSGRPQYGILSYTSNNTCRDGVARDLNVRFRQGNDSVTTAQQFQLSADPATGVSVNLGVDTASITSGASRNVAVKLTPAVQNQRLYPGVITLNFDTNLLTLNQAITAGTMSAGMNASVTPTATGATVTLANTATLNGSGNLLLLNFTAGEVTANTDTRVTIASVQFDRGCITTQNGEGRITVRPKNAALAISSSPVVFNWDSGSGRYNPDPAVVSVEVSNVGDLPVTALSARLGNSPDVRIAYGGVQDVVVIPDSLGPGQKGTAVFYVQALPVASERTAQVSIEITGNPVTRTGTLFFNIKAADATVRTLARVDEILVQAGNYTPDPATFTAAVRAIGTQTSPGGTVKLDLPGGVTVSSSETQSFAAMQPNDSTVLVWQLQYPKDGSAASYIIGVITEPTGKAADTSYVTMYVPELMSEQWTSNCDIAPKRLLWSASAGAYNPAEAEFSVTVENTGSVEIPTITAGIQLPAGIVLAPGENAQKNFSGIGTGQQQTLTWKLRPVTRCADADVDIQVSLLGASGTPRTCVTSLFVQSANSGAPTVAGRTPAQLDTLDRGSAATFTVDATDPDGLQLLYEWGVNGVFEPSRPDNSYSKEFSINGQFEVVCRILDPCAVRGEGDTTIVTWNFTVRSSLSTTPLPTAGDFAILANYPNPFNPGTTVEFKLPMGRQRMRLDVVDATGRVVRTLLDEVREGGVHNVYFDAAGLPSGVYTLRLHSGSSVRSHQVTLIK